MDGVYVGLKTSGETVEKVPKQTLGGDAEKNDFTECATINDLTMMKGRETPKNQALTILKGFSTVSEERATNFTVSGGSQVLAIFLCRFFASPYHRVSIETKPFLSQLPISSV